MKTKSLVLGTTLCLLPLIIVPAAWAAGPALQGSLMLRGLTPQEIKDYSLTGKQIASGLNTVGIGQPAYLDAMVNIAVPTADITSVVFNLTGRATGSTAVLAASPLGTNVPPGKIADRTAFKVAGRALLVPDVPGQYTVSVTIQTGNSGSTNLTQVINAGTYMGINTCALCHSGGVIASNIVSSWTLTLHAHAFEEAIDGVSTDHFSKNCISCHVLGYDTNPLAANGGFDDVWATNGWIFPTNFNLGNFAAMPDSLKNLANIQCENCHGAGSLHAYSLGSTNLISKTLSTSACSQCHDSLNFHYKTAEWNNSRHAVATRIPSGGTNRYNCVRCHTAPGFVQFLAQNGSTNTYATNIVYEAITCSACHDPHDKTNPQQLRTPTVYTLPEGTVVTNAGLGALCMNCHHSRNGSVSNNIANFQKNQPTWANGVSFGVHDSTAGDMIEGVNGQTYGKFIPSGSHSVTISNVCVGCHMQPVASSDPAFTKAGGHTFSMTYPAVSGGVTNVVDKVDVCVKCHGPLSSFDMVRKDYNCDGVIEGIQTEVQKMLDQLSTLLPNSTYRADGNYVADGLVKTSISAKTNWPVRFLNAGWNWQFVNVEGSKGIHNAPYAIGLLRASIADLTDDFDKDGLSDNWENAKFGSINAYTGFDDPDRDGVNNFLELASGTNALLADSDGDGINDLAELQAGSDPTNPLDQPQFLVRLYPAGELEFASQTGQTYQIQMVTELSTTWTQVSTNIPGTGGNISRLVSTRNGGVQAYYRVVKLAP